ncbi:MAG: Asp-tRNA(Asn)/Glu-tRNA(Gln) amidotransferase GatCAB subunit B, partial [Oscillospiraceae bacterium]|nr:Asp-tRNA(Asn)/Glu-tRNA(Gln) amidotransferase GatCAB subunit B [Oscillospiraceae bacterium]
DEQDLWIKEDTEQLSAVIDEIIANNPKAAEQYRNGDQKVFGFFMGQANKALKGAASPKAIQEQLIAKLRR